jgi:hypothetical protein
VRAFLGATVRNRTVGDIGRSAPRHRSRGTLYECLVHGDHLFAFAETSVSQDLELGKTPYSASLKDLIMTATGTRSELCVRTKVPQENQR